MNLGVDALSEQTASTWASDILCGSTCGFLTAMQAAGPVQVAHVQNQPFITRELCTAGLQLTAEQLKLSEAAMRYFSNGEALQPGIVPDSPAPGWCTCSCVSTIQGVIGMQGLLWAAVLLMSN